MSGVGVGVGGHSITQHCPYCGDDNLFPHGTRHRDWECRSCRRAFSVSFLGLLTPAGTERAP